MTNLENEAFLTAEEADQEITVKQERLETVRSEMENLKEQYVALFKPFFAEWIMKSTKDQVVRHPEIVDATSESILRELKSNADQLVKTSPQFVQQNFSNQFRWPHIREEKIDEERFDAMLNDVLENLTHYVGTGLLRSGFLREPVRQPRGGVAVEFDNGSWKLSRETQTNQVIGATCSIERSSELVDLERSYKSLLPVFMQSLESYKEAAAQKRRLDVGRKWDAL